MGAAEAEPAALLVRCAVLFEPADPPRTGALVFWRPDGAALPDGSGRLETVDVVVPDGAMVRRRRVPARRPARSNCWTWRPPVVPRRPRWTSGRTRCGWPPAGPTG